MNLRCGINWHRWGLWQSVPITSNPNTNGWMAGQMRQCADCLLLQSRKIGDGYAFNHRPLRNAVNDHIQDLERCVKVFTESEHADAFHKTSMEMRKAADELRTALNADLGIPKES